MGNDLFVFYIVGEHAAVDDHCTGSSSGKPAFVQNFFRFTCAEVMPVAIAPYFDPCMVVITMRPSWGVDLTGWDTNTAEYSGSKGGFFTAAAISTAQNGQWVCSTLVGQTVGSIFKAPVVELQSSFFHAGGFAGIHQSRPAQIIEVAAAVNDIFVVDAVVENMV